MIPQEHSAAVTLGLKEAFGVTEYEDIRDLTERPGSNRVFRIIVRGSANLLRINTRQGETTLHFNCMQAAAETGLAPRVRYASAEDRISITDYVKAMPLPAPGALVRIPAAGLACTGAVSHIPLQYHLQVCTEPGGLRWTDSSRSSVHRAFCPKTRPTNF